MATEETGSTTPAKAPESTSAPAGTTGQGGGGSSLLTTPPAVKAEGTTDAAPPKDVKAEDAKAGEGAGGKPTGETPPADIELKLPQGFAPDEAALGEFKTLAKESGLKGETAQKVFDLYVKQQAAMEATRAAQALEARKAQSEKWAQAARADKEYGGAGFDESLEHAKKGIARFASPALRELLNESGLGNHPELIRAFTSIGKALGEDSTQGANSHGGVSSQEQRLRSRYPTMFSE